MRLSPTHTIKTFLKSFILSIRHCKDFGACDNFAAMRHVTNVPTVKNAPAFAGALFCWSLWPDQAL
jgi:hypothetical protein